MIVTNPIRALTPGRSVAPEDFPGLPVDSVTWTTADDGTLALDVAFADGYTPTPEDEQTVYDTACSLDADDQTLRSRIRTALATNRTFRDTTTTQLETGADTIIANPALTQANIRQLAQGVKTLTAQVESLTRQNIALGHMLLRDDATD